MRLNTFLRWTILGGLFLILFLPLFVDGSLFFPFITGKNFGFRIIVEIIFAAWVILMLREPASRPKKSLIFYAFAAFVGVMALADIFGEDFYRSFWSNYERMEGLVTLLHLFAYFTVLTSVITTRKLWERFLQTSLGVSVILAVYGILQLAGKLQIHQGTSRLDATLGNATYLAAYMVFHIFIAAFLAIRANTPNVLRFVYGGIALLDGFVLYHTATRGGILGLLGGAFLTTALLILFAKSEEHKTARKVAIGAFIGVLVVIGGFFALKDTNFIRHSPVLSRFANISLTETTTESRFIIWGMALKGVAEHPILGWGQDNFNLIFNKYYDPRLYNQEPFFDRAHNVFLDWLTAGGILGLLAYLSMFGAAVYYIWKRREEDWGIAEKSVLTGLFAAYFFQNLFVFDNLTSYLMFFTMLGFLHVNVVRNRKPNGAEISAPAPADRYTQVVAGTIAVAALMFVFYTVNLKGILTGQELIRALGHYDAGPTENLAHFKKALSYDSFGTPEAREQLVVLTQQVVAAQSIDEDTKNKFAVFARDEILDQIKRSPNDARYELFAGMFFHAVGSYDDAIAHFARALELSPRKQQVYFELLSAYISKGNYAKALDLAKKAYELDTSDANARDVYALAAIYAGDRTLTEELLVPAYGTIAVPDDRFIRAFAVTGDFKTVIEIWKARIAKIEAAGQDNTDWRISLAAAYLQSGQRQKSIETLQKAIELNSGFKDQGEYYIGEIRAGRNP